MIVVDAEGTIMMVSQAVQKTFGYAKIELEGTNVSALMPQPFSQRHPGYMQVRVLQAPQATSARVARRNNGVTLIPSSYGTAFERAYLSRALPQRYVGGGEPHMLDSVREVVALHKERYVFPVQVRGCQLPLVARKLACGIPHEGASDVHASD